MCYLVDLAVLADHSENKMKGKAGQIPAPCPRAEKAVEHESDSNSNNSWCPCNVHQEPGKEIPRTGD